MKLSLSVKKQSWPFASPFRIAYRSRTVAETVMLELSDGIQIGRAEASGVSYHGETAESIMAQIQSAAGALSRGLDRGALQELMPAGGARNAIDCALWDLEAKRSGRRAWELAGTPSVMPLRTSFTLGLDEPEAMGRAAAAAVSYSIIKIKLGGGDDADVDRVRAVRLARPRADLIVDANQGWSERDLRHYLPALREMGVHLVEQPLPAGQDGPLQSIRPLVPICADEACQTTASLEALLGKYQYVNIKLDKTGGLTEALRLADSAAARGFNLMVGCMAGSSLAMAPAFIVGQRCRFVDLDGPLLSTSDVLHPIRYNGSEMGIPARELWG